MQTPYSKQDELIDEGVHALREQAIDTSQMANVLKPKSTRSIVLPVGLATASACAIGALVLMTPTKADAAGEFEKVKKAVLNQRAVYEKVYQRGKDDVWEVRLETWHDGKKKGAKLESGKGTYEVVIDGNVKYEKAPDQKFFKAEPIVRKGELLLPDVKRDDEVLELEVIGQQLTESTISEVMAEEGVQFLGIKRSQKKDGRACDIYRLKQAGQTNETIYYVDPKTDLPFLMEVVDENGVVIDRVGIDFPGEIKLELKVSGKDIYRVVPSGTIRVDSKGSKAIEVKGGVYEIELDTPKRTEPPKP